jgi:hypothetical protein
MKKGGDMGKTVSRLNAGQMPSVNSRFLSIHYCLLNKHAPRPIS